MGRFGGMQGTRRAGLVASALLVLIAAQPVEADVSVEMSGTTLVVRDGFDPDSPAEIIIEHFADSERNGTRVRGMSFPDETITSDDADCTHNSFLNDVVCTPFPSKIVVVDSFIADNKPSSVIFIGGSNVGCDQHPGTPVEVNLGLGSDVLGLSTACGGQTSATGVNRLHPFFPTRSDGTPGIDGGSGNDDIDGGRLNDVISGGTDSDELFGAAGADTLLGGVGNDELRGSTGNDTLDGGGGADVHNGGSGVDVANYGLRGSPVTVTLDGVANDGAAGENDSLTAIETVIGGAGGDDLDGNNGANKLIGGDGDDTLEGDDGVDELLGQGDNDVIDSHDVPAVQDSVACGFGFDTVIADLQDSVPIRHPFSDFGCESVQRFAADDGPPGRVLGRSVLIRRSGRLRLRLRCPRRARVTCKGRLRLKHVGKRRTLASRRYKVRRGRTKTIRLKVSRRAARRARARKAIVVRTRERGVSEKSRFRGSVVRLRVWR